MGFFVVVFAKANFYVIVGDAAYLFPPFLTLLQAQAFIKVFGYILSLKRYFSGLSKYYVN